MRKRPYYSIRTGRNPNAPNISLQLFLRLFKELFLSFEEKDYFQESFGYYCVDQDEVPGKLGRDISAVLLRKLRKDNLWPILDKYEQYSEDDLFDMIEFLHDHISYPVDGYYHDYCDCGWHYSEFDTSKGREEFRQEVNELLRDYSSGYELSESGEILILADSGIESLFEAPVPTEDTENIRARVASAVVKFRRSRSSLDDRRDAIRDLADVLEFLRPKVREVLASKDESDLFELANRYGIRHHRPDQKTDYDKPIFYSWMFYYYLATIHAALRLIQKGEGVEI